MQNKSSIRFKTCWSEKLLKHTAFPYAKLFWSAFYLQTFNFSLPFTAFLYSDWIRRYSVSILCRFCSWMKKMSLNVLYLSVFSFSWIDLVNSGWPMDSGIPSSSPHYKIFFFKLLRLFPRANCVIEIYYKSASSSIKNIGFKKELLRKITSRMVQCPSFPLRLLPHSSPSCVGL